MDVDTFIFMNVVIGITIFFLIFMALIVRNIRSRKLTQKEEPNNYINNKTNTKPTTCFTIPILPSIVM